MIRISSFKSIVGTTWVVSEGYCVLAYTKSESAARRERVRIWRERRDKRRLSQNPLTVAKPTS